MMACLKNSMNAFFNEINTYLVNILNCSFSCGRMTSLQRQAKIILIGKKLLKI